VPGTYVIRYSTADSHECESFDPFILMARGYISSIECKDKALYSIRAFLRLVSGVKSRGRRFDSSYWELLIAAWSRRWLDSGMNRVRGYRI
jgi:hypothetical protein